MLFSEEGWQRHAATLTCDRLVDDISAGFVDQKLLALDGSTTCANLAHKGCKVPVVIRGPLVKGMFMTTRTGHPLSEEGLRNGFHPVFRGAVNLVEVSRSNLERGATCDDDLLDDFVVGPVLSDGIPDPLGKQCRTTLTGEVSAHPLRVDAQQVTHPEGTDIGVVIGCKISINDFATLISCFIRGKGGYLIRCWLFATEIQRDPAEKLGV